MKNCSHCNQPIKEEALKCRHCQRWLIDITKQNDPSGIILGIFIIILIFGIYHALVTKAMRIDQVRQCHHPNTTQIDYNLCKEQITYWKTFFDFKKILLAFD